MKRAAAIKLLEIAPSDRWRAFLAGQAKRLSTPDMVARPWHWQGLHNPWSRAAVIYDAWGFLDLCSDVALLAPVRQAIGDDVILFDSFWLPDRWQQMAERPLDDPVFFPVRPRAGVSVVVSFADDAAMGPHALGVRYFPATSQYVRAAADSLQLALMERLPLVNAAAAPLWLVSGRDRADNDFVTGFNPRPVFWSEQPGF